MVWLRGVSGALVVGAVSAVATTVFGHTHERTSMRNTDDLFATGVVAYDGSVIQGHAVATTKAIGLFNSVFAIQATVLGVFGVADLTTVIWKLATTTHKACSTGNAQPISIHCATSATFIATE